MVEKDGKRVYVRGQWVEFTREEINRLFNMDGSKFKKQLKELEH